MYRHMLFTTWTVGVSFSDLIAVIGSPPPDEVLESLKGLLMQHYEGEVIGYAYLDEVEMLLITFKHRAQAEDCRDTWEQLVDIITGEKDWRFSPPEEG